MATRDCNNLERNIGMIVFNIFFTLFPVFYFFLSRFINNKIIERTNLINLYAI